MKLDTKNAQGIIDHLKSKWGEKAQCSKCYKSADYNFIAGEIRVFVLTEYHGGGLVIGGDQVQIPVVPIICNNCGRVDLLKIDFLNEAQKEKPTEEKQ